MTILASELKDKLINGDKQVGFDVTIALSDESFMKHRTIMYKLKQFKKFNFYFKIRVVAEDNRCEIWMLDNFNDEDIINSIDYPNSRIYEFCEIPFVYYPDFYSIVMDLTTVDDDTTVTFNNIKNTITLVASTIVKKFVLENTGITLRNYEDLNSVMRVSVRRYN